MWLGCYKKMEAGKLGMQKRAQGTWRRAKGRKGKNKKMGKFQDLKVWQRAKDLAFNIYKLTSEGKFVKDFNLRDQIRRAGVSIPSNIAEGDELGTDKQAIRHFFIAKGSSAEVLTQAIISYEIGYINGNDYKYIEAECKAISGMTMKLIQARSKP